MEEKKEFTVEEVQQKLVAKMIYLDNMERDIELHQERLETLYAEKMRLFSWYANTISKRAKEIECLAEKEEEKIKIEMDYIIKKMATISKAIGRRPRIKPEEE